MSVHDTATLLVSCRDRTGLVATLSNFVYVNAGNILDLDQHADEASDSFYMRLQWSLADFTLDRTGIAAALAGFGRSLGLEWSLTYGSDRQRVAVLVSKTPHCLYDLLQHHQLGELGGDIVVVASNHAELRPVAAHFDIPFVHIAVEAGAKTEAEHRQTAMLAEYRIDLVVLAVGETTPEQREDVIKCLTMTISNELGTKIEVGQAKRDGYVGTVCYPVVFNEGTPIELIIYDRKQAYTDCVNPSRIQVRERLESYIDVEAHHGGALHPFSILVLPRA